MNTWSAEAGRRPKPAVVVTGLGVVSCVGIGTDAFWSALLSGTVGTGAITRFDARALSAQRAGEVRDFDPLLHLPVGFGECAPRATQFALAVTRMACEDARLEQVNGERVGVCFGTVLGNRPAMEGALLRLRRDDGVPLPGGALDAPLLSRAPAAAFGLLGPNAVVSTGCAAGNSAIAFGVDAIRSGRADAMVVGGAEELSPAIVTMFHALRALTPDVVRPFDLHRKGVLLAEGAAALVLENGRTAAERGARAYCQVLGHGSHADAYHLTAPHPEGRGAVRSIQAALQMAGVSPADVDYVNAHGTGTALNDAAESRAIRSVFGTHAGRVPVSSVKGMLGHAQGAASALEAVCCVLAIRDGLVPPNANYETPDPACALRIVRDGPLRGPVGVALNNAFGFGGNICCVVFGALGIREERAA